MPVYHPLLFTLMLLCGLAELGLTAFLISSGNESGTWPTPDYHALLILLCFNAAWTTLFSTTYMLWYFDGARHFLANVASSVIWLLVTTILWGVGTGLMHGARIGTGGDCDGRPTLSKCRQSLTVEGLGWAEFGVCASTLLLTVFWVCTSTFAGRNKAFDSEANV